MMSSNTPSPRSAPNTPIYGQQAYYAQSPSVSPLSCPNSSRTPPSFYNKSPLNTNNDNHNVACYDVINRLKNRLEIYRGHHENSLHKERAYLDQYNFKVKAETSKLVKKQTATNESNSRKKNSTGSTGVNKQSRSGNASNSQKRAASNSDSNRSTLLNSGQNFATEANPLHNQDQKIKIPKLTAKQRKQSKPKNQQPLISLETSISNVNQSNFIGNNGTFNTTSNSNMINDSSVYKFIPNSPNEMKSPMHFLSSNSGRHCGWIFLRIFLIFHIQNFGLAISSPYSQSHSSVPMMKQHDFNDSSETYLGDLDANSLNVLLESDCRTNGLDRNRASLIPDDDSKDLINQILDLDPDVSSNFVNNSSSNEYSIFGNSADDSLSNRFGDEDFIKKMLEDLNNSPEITTVHHNHQIPISSLQPVTQSQDLNSANNNNHYDSYTSIPSYQPISSNQFEGLPFHSYSNQSAMNHKSINHCDSLEHNSMPRFDQFDKTQNNSSLPPFDSLSLDNHQLCVNQQSSIINGQRITHQHYQQPHHQTNVYHIDSRVSINSSHSNQYHSNQQITNEIQISNFQENFSSMMQPNRNDSFRNNGTNTSFFYQTNESQIM